MAKYFERVSSINHSTYVNVTSLEQKSQMPEYSSLKSNQSCDINKEVFFSFQIFRQQGPQIQRDSTVAHRAILQSSTVVHLVSFIYQIYKYTCVYTWSYENRVSKHFVIFLNFPCLIACLLCCLLMSFFCLFCGEGFEQKWMQTELLSYPLPYFFLTHNFLFNTSDSYLKSVRA